MLSYSTWQSRFQGDKNILGKKILLDRKPYVVIGVMPRNFEFPLEPGHLNRSELWVPMSFTAGELAPTSAAQLELQHGWAAEAGGYGGAGGQATRIRWRRRRCATIRRSWPGFSMHPVGAAAA